MTKKPKKNYDILYRVFCCVINIILDVCAFMFCAVTAIACAMVHRMWPDGLIFMALCVVIAWTNIRDLRFYLKEKKEKEATNIALPASLGTRIYYVSLERDQVECGEIIGGALLHDKTYMVLHRKFPLDMTLPHEFKMATDSTFFFTYEAASIHLAEIRKKNSAARLQGEMAKLLMKEANEYAEN